MNRKSSLGAFVFAALIAAVFVGSAVSPVASFGAMAGPHASTPRAAPASPDFLALAQSHLATPHERAAFLSQLLGTSPAVLSRELTHAGLKGASPASIAELQTFFDVHPADGQNFINIGTGALGGCVAGGVIGGIAGSVFPGLGTAVGAGVGCLIGAVAGALVVAYATSAGTAVFTLKNEDAFQQAQASTISNYNNITVGSAITTMSLFNQTTYAWESMADALVRNQLGNATFNFTMVLVQSQIIQQLQTLIYGYGIAPGVMIANLNQIEYSIYSTPSLTGVNDGMVFGNGACMGVCGLGGWFGGIGSYDSVSVNSGSTMNVFVRPGTESNASCMASTGTARNLVTNVTVTLPHYTGQDTSTSSLSGYYVINPGIATSCGVSGTGVFAFDLNPFNSVTNSFGDAFCGRGSIGAGPTPKTTPPSGCDPLKSFTIYNTAYPDSVTAFNTSLHAAIGPTLPIGNGPIAGSFNAPFNVIQHAAMTNAFTYWQFLRAQGYTSFSQIPSNCVIPYPVDAVPNVGALNSGTTASINDTMTAYAAWMNGLATFFNAAPNATGWCHGHGTFVGASSAAPQFGENISGFILTLPQGTHQKGNLPHTWAVNGTNAPWNGTTPAGATNATPINMVLWPTIMGVKIPLNTVVRIAQNNPLEGYVQQSVTFYTLNGNGSAQAPNGTLTGVNAVGTAGAALYLTHCAIKGVDENPCALTLSNLTAFIFNLSCSPNCNPAPAPTPSTPSFTAIFCGIPLLGELCTLLGSGIGSLLVLLVIIVIVFVIIYAAVRIYRAREYD